MILFFKKLLKVSFFILFFISTAVNSKDFQPSFKGINIKEFINIVGKNLKKTMIINEDVEGEVTVKTQYILNEKEYYQFFLNVLYVYGYSAININNQTLKIVKLKKGIKSSTLINYKNKDNLFDTEYITTLIKVNNISSGDLVPFLNEFKGDNGLSNITNNSETNTLMITSNKKLLDKMIEIIERVDRQGKTSFNLITLSYSSPTEIITIFNEVNSKEHNAFINVEITTSHRNNTLIITGTKNERLKALDFIKSIDIPTKNNSYTRVYYLNHSKAVDIVKVINDVNFVFNSKDFKVTSHIPTNSIIINSNSDLLNSFELIIKKLDIPRAQVHIEAIIVEIFETDGINVGVQLFNDPNFVSQFNDGHIPISNIVKNQNSTDTSNLINSFSALSGGLLGIYKNDWTAIIQAVSNDTNSNILATPSITTLDNEKASFLVGQEVPIITGSQTGDDNSNPFQTVEREEVGIKLLVTPQINEGDSLQLVIEQEVSSVSGATGVDITINKREIKTTVRVKNGSTVILGGLIDEDVQETIQKVPLLGDIPFIGALFTSTSVKTRKRNLMVFLKPTIVSNPDSFNSLTKLKYNSIRNKQKLIKDNNSSLINFSKLPLLLKFNDDLLLPPKFDDL